MFRPHWSLFFALVTALGARAGVAQENSSSPGSGVDAQDQIADAVSKDNKPPRIIETLDPYKLFGSNHVPAGSYVPLNSKERFNYFIEDTFASPRAIVQPFFSALGNQISNAPPQWDGFAGYLQRTGTRALFLVFSKSIEASLSAVVGTERRYYPCYCSGTWRRIGHAILFQFITVNRNGHKVVNLPGILGSYGGEMVAAAPFPGPYDPWRAVRNGNGFFYRGWWYNVLKEFSPDLSRFVRGFWTKGRLPSKKPPAQATPPLPLPTN